ncbi:hypothetical protein UFOVP276_62 [uncultured Caudovirales phage]|uniref:Uncharacterized protein n=1 Tax=uncultured Caudovirales phage TaxID=2100421 RepID=A0A6J5LBE6_9CAUD|nr:hypothetical protein UFOVP127_199 [uncultured Caudovirales phage]CAB4135074.1 hypothetical protein UFOVP276_62 [uncultured Caudovirales phage]
MTPSRYAAVASIMRTKVANEVTEAAKKMTIGEMAGSLRRGTGHVWDAANVGAQHAAEHLTSKGAPKLVAGAIHAAPVVGAAYLGLKGLQGLSNWNTNRIMRNQMQGGY